MKAHYLAALAALLGLAGLNAVNAQSYYRTVPSSTYYYPYYGGYYQEGPEPGAWYYDFYRPRATTGTTTTATRTGEMRGTQVKAQQLTGEVLRLKRVDVQGGEEQVQVALVNTPDNKRVIVDLGPADELKTEGFRLRKGEELQLRGWYSKVGHHRVFIANRLTANDVTTDITRRPSTRRLEKEARAVGVEEAEETPAKGERGATERRSGYRGKGERGEMEMQNIQGKITQMKQVTLPGQNRPWCAALVQTKDGQKYLVNLGPKNKLEELDLEKGTQVSIRGPVCRCDGEYLMLGERIRANGHTYEANEEGETTQPATREIAGTVQTTRMMQPPGAKNRWRMVQIKDKDGQEFFVNLGPEEETEHLELNKGQRVTINGDCVEFHGKEFCLAKRIRANGQSFRVNEQQEE
jgi:hypothetical protein